jgi:hypothetical protein
MLGAQVFNITQPTIPLLRKTRKTKVDHSAESVLATVNVQPTALRLNPTRSPSTASFCLLRNRFKKGPKNRSNCFLHNEEH